MAQPCEICGNRRAGRLGSKHQDRYRIAQPGSKAIVEGYEFQRICGKCAVKLEAIKER